MPGLSRRLFAARPSALMISAVATITLTLASHQPTFAAEQCLLTQEKTAFDVVALQTQLMIAALSCGQQDEYNRFVQRHQRELLGVHRVLTGHFERIYGSSSEDKRDEYTADLANAQSLDGIRQGPRFCGNVKPFVMQAMTLENVDEMSRFVGQNNVNHAHSLAVCQDSFETKLNEAMLQQDTPAHRPR